MRSTDNVTKRVEQLIKAGAVGVAVGRDLMERLAAAVEHELEQGRGAALAEFVRALIADSGRHNGDAFQQAGDVSYQAGAASPQAGV